jgi:hypothetical protein
MFQNIAPLFLLATPTYAQVTPVVSDILLAFDNEEHQLIINGSTNTDTEYLLTYDDNDESTPPAAVTGTVNGLNFQENIFVGTCSSEECVEDEFTNGSLEFPGSDYQADFQIIDDVLWLTRNNLSSVAQVELNKTYLAPQNNQVSVTFTSLPENPGTLNIEEITLTDEQVESLGALSNLAYDITSSMEDGSFTYDLTLPLPEGADETAKVVYAESVDGLATAEELTKTITGNEIKAEGVDHFTVFVVTLTDPTAMGVDATATTDQAFSGSGSWLNNPGPLDGDKLTLYVYWYGTGDFNDISFNIEDIEKIEYHTLKDSSTPSHINFYASIYTMPYDGSPGSSWYGDRLTLEPEYSLNKNEVADTWTKWSTDIGDNQLTLFDSVRGNFGFYHPPTLDLIQSGDVDWSNYPNSGTTDVVNYATQQVKGISFGTGSAWDTQMLAYLDSITITLKNGESTVIDLDVPDISSIAFVGSPKYVRENNGSDLAAQITVPDFISEVNFIIDGNTSSPVTVSTETSGAPSGFKWFRLYTPLAAGEHTISAQVDVLGTLTDVGSTATAYSIDTPDFQYLSPILNKFYRPSDGYARIKIDDEFNQFVNVTFAVYQENGTHVGNYLVNRNECDLRNQGNNVVCDLTRDYSGSNPALTSGNYYVKIQTKDIAKGGVRYNHGNSKSEVFTVDNESPVVNSIVSKYPTSIYRNSIDLLIEATDNNSVVNVLSYYTEKRNDGQCDPNQPKIDQKTTTFIDIDGKFEVNFDTTALNGEYCFFAVAEDVANSHSNPQQGKTIFSFDNEAPPTPTNLRRLGYDGNEYQCSDLSLRQNMIPMWDEYTGNDFDHYEYSSFNAGGSQGLDEKVLYENKLDNTWVAPNDGTYGFAVRTVDIAGNKSDWALTDETLDGSCQITYDSEYPEMSDIKMFVNGNEATLSKSGDEVKVQATISDVSGVDKAQIWVREFPWSPNNNQLIAGEMTNIGGDVWEYIFTVSTTYQDGDAINQEIDGNYFNFRPFDSVGNSHIGWRENFTIDNINPVTTLTSPSDEFTTNGGIQITGSSTDLNKVAEVNLYYSIAGEDDWQLITTLTNSGSDEPFAFDYTWNPSVEGVYDIKVSGTDVAGNVENSAYAYGIVYDVTGPTKPTWGTIYKGHGVVAANEIGCGEYTNDTKITLEWNENSDSDLKGYWFGTKFNPKHQWFNAGSNVKTANMTAGNNPYFYTIIAVDNADNESTISDQCGLTLDQDAPNVEITNPASGLVTGTVDIRGTVEDDNPHHYWFVIQNSSGTTVAGPGVVNDTSSFTDTSLLSWDTTLVDDGTYTIKLEARDSADNKDGGSSHWIEVIVDHINPSSIITSYGLDDGEEVETSTFSGLIEGTATDDSSGVDHVLLSISHLGFEEEESARKYWNATGSAWVTTQSVFSATGSDIWSYQLPEAGIVEGFYEISSHAVDVAGNVENTYTIKIVYDKTIPEVVLTIDPTTPDGDRGWYRFTNPAISLTASDNYDIDKIQYQWNSPSGTWTTYSTPINPPGEGQNILYYRSIDKVGNISEVGVKEVKYDATKPAGDPLNVKVEKITSNTADASWEAPDPDDDVSFYRLSWKHEDGTVHGAETGNDDFNHQLDKLYDGVWTLYVKAMDEAGNFTEKKVDFRVGPGPSTGGSDDGDVLGVTSPEGTGIGGAFPSSTLLANADDSEPSTQSGTEDNLGETVEVADENGEVLGLTVCSGFNNYLPLIILVSIFIMIIIFEVMYQGSSISRVLVSIGLVAALVALFYLVRDGQCEIEPGMLKTINNWFVGLAALTGIAAKMLAHAFLKGE